MEEAEAARLQGLERKRQTLMSGDDLGDDLQEPEELPAGGYARKRAKRRQLEQEAEERGSGKALFQGMAFVLQERLGSRHQLLHRCCKHVTPPLMTRQIALSVCAWETMICFVEDQTPTAHMPLCISSSLKRKAENVAFSAFWVSLMQFQVRRIPIEKKERVETATQRRTEGLWEKGSWVWRKGGRKELLETTPCSSASRRSPNRCSRSILERVHQVKYSTDFKVVHQIHSQAESDCEDTKEILNSVGR